MELGLVAVAKMRKTAAAF
jgi:hypothetical protein